MFESGLFGLGLVSAARFDRPEEFNPEREVSIVTAWLDATFEGSSRKACRASFWRFVEHASGKLKLTMDTSEEAAVWKQVRAARSAGTLHLFLSSYV